MTATLDRPDPVTAPIPITAVRTVTEHQPTVIDVDPTCVTELPVDLIQDASYALSEALASAQAGLRTARERGIPAPLGVTATATGIHASAPLDDVLEWQKLLDPVRVSHADYQAGLVRIEGEYDGQTWTLTSMQHRRITGSTR